MPCVFQFFSLHFIILSFRTPDAIAVKQLIMNTSNPSDFERFEFLLRFDFHDLVHCVIDGTMCSIDSASAPEFFLHHGFVDKIWWDWQRLSRNHTFNEYFLTQKQRMPGTVYRSETLLDLNDQPGCVCAEYVPSRSKIYRALQGRLLLISFSRSMTVEGYARGGGGWGGGRIQYNIKKSEYLFRFIIY